VPKPQVYGRQEIKNLPPVFLLPFCSTSCEGNKEAKIDLKVIITSLFNKKFGVSASTRG